MAEPLRPDLCVIGAGSGGLSVAAAAAQFGVATMLIERGRMGGDCLNYGCVPSKALLAAAKAAETMRRADRFGMAAVEPEIDFGKLHDHVHGVIADIRPNDSAERYTGLGVQVIQGEAKFLNKRTVAVGETRIQARRFVVATGSEPAIPDIPGLGEVSYLTNDTIFDLAEPIAHLAVIGAGPIGVELGQAYRRLGAEVTLLDRAEPLQNFDPEGAGVVLRVLAAEGIAIHTGVAVDRVAQGESGITVHFTKNGEAASVEASHLLVATGRKPSLASLDLKAARIRHDETGIKVNARMKTRNSRVYAVGDVVGPPYFTHLASYHAELVMRNALFRLRPSLDLTRVPRALYTEPELAEIGISEAAAKKYDRNTQILRWPFADNDRAEAERETQGFETQGFVKLIVSAKGRLYGAMVVGPDAGELIATLSLLRDKELTVGDLAQTILPYPTRAEALKRAAVLFYRDLPRKPIVRRVIALLRKLG